MNAQRAIAPGDPTSADEPAVRVHGLAKSFAERRPWRAVLRHPLVTAPRIRAVHAVSFDVAPGEFFGLLGANGAGKTTLFRMLATQLLPDSGTALIAGQDIGTAPRAVRRVLACVSADERSLHWRLTARANLELFAALQGVPRETVDGRVRELLGTVGLADTDSLVGSFSSGMKQRLLIARALLANPRVLLLDEPTRSLDPVAARDFRTFLREEVAGRQRCAVLLATHIAEEALDLCDRVAVLDHGRVLAVGTPSDLVRSVRSDACIAAIDTRHAARVLAGIEGVTRARVLAEQDAWIDMELRIPDGPAGAARVLAALTAAGVGVASFRPVEPTLADLLEGIVARGRDA